MASAGSRSPWRRCSATTRPRSSRRSTGFPQRGVAILGVAQLPRLRRDRPDLRPTLADFGATGAAKQHADVVLGLYREEMYRPGSGVEGAAELMVLKNRGGAAGFADLYFHRRWLRFADLLDHD